MAQRYGGRFSPDGQPQNAPEPITEASFRGRTPQRHGVKINLLFLLPLGVAISAFTQPPIAMATDLGGAVLLLLAAWLLRDGIRAEDAYNERTVARRPAIPRKIFATVATAAGLFALVFGGDWQLLNALIIAIVGGGLHLFIFQFDPMTDKGMEGIDRMQSDRVAEKIDTAEKYLVAMTDAIKRATDRDLEARVERFQATARQMFRTIEEDPRDLSQARKYLGVYLKGARDATIKFADLYGRNRDIRTRADYVSLLEDLDKNFSARTRKMLLDDSTDLDVEIEVLRDRLSRDGLST
jgi:5-bromo-4-chloroindolyl phosphate hydrolysis protein